MQRLMVADGKADACSGEPQNQMMATQRDGNVMALAIFHANQALATRIGFRLGHGALGIRNISRNVNLGTKKFDADKSQHAELPAC
jgi:hypothetical protein